MISIPFGLIVSGTFLSIVFWMAISFTLGKEWVGTWVLVAGYAMGALSGLGWAVGRVEKGNLKLSALVNAPSMRSQNQLR